MMLTDTNISINFNLSNFSWENNKTALNYPTKDFFYDPWKIKDEYKNTEIEKILSYFPNDIGEARIIILEPGKSYFSHADIDDRYHLNIQSENSFLIDLNNYIMFPIIKDNKIWDMNTGLLHTASNFGSINRIQLVVRKLLKHNTLENKSKIKITPINMPFDYRYKFDNIVSPYLNQSVKNKKLDNFSVNKNTISFYFDKNYIKELLDIIKSMNIDHHIDVEYNV
jgi:hypothetical protein